MTIAAAGEYREVPLVGDAPPDRSTKPRARLRAQWTIEAYRAGRDPAMEAVAAALR